MNRRDFLGLLGAGAAATALPARFKVPAAVVIKVGVDRLGEQSQNVE